jgi:hypothetical protein
VGAVQQATVGSRFTRVQRVELALDFRQPIIRGDFQRPKKRDPIFFQIRMGNEFPIHAKRQHRRVQRRHPQRQQGDQGIAIGLPSLRHHGPDRRKGGAGQQQ